ncbi:MAG: DUF3748 domain-containing protein [Ignavibacteriae bacterium]|nr:DUF3748 domain-containing protein [Ignavibacteriota bacterium]
MCRILILSLAYLSLSCSNVEEVQLSNDYSKNFDLDGRHNFSPDDKWLVYDTRPVQGGIDDCKTIEKINVETGEVVILYDTSIPERYGPGVGAASYSPTEEKVIFIHGLQNNSEERPYEQWRRTGVIIDENHIEIPIFLDARDVTPPFTVGALRGGTHDHEWSGDGKWIAFTYNDAIMKELEDRTGELWNLRTIGVSKPIGSVKVDHTNNNENVDGIWYSVLVVQVIPNPTPGSDEISHAASDSWIGKSGYQKLDKTWQRARAFLGTVRSSKGESIPEVFVVDIPDKINKSSINGVLEGTVTTFPNPPKGTIQRRLTHTAERKYPGCIGTLRCSKDGKFIAYRKKDNIGIIQIFFISPLDGKSVQVSHHKSDVQSTVRWSPNGHFIYYVFDNSIVECNVNVQSSDEFGNTRKITKRSPQPPLNIVLSNNGKIIAFNREVESNSGKGMIKQIYKISVK